MLSIRDSSTFSTFQAFEISVFKPWRQENWPDGIGEGIKRELRRTREDFREAAQEIRDLANGRAPRGAVHRRDGNNERRPNNRHTRGGRAQDTDSGSEDDYGSDEVGGGRNKLDRSVSVHGGDEFEMHETEVLRQRERLRKMFGDNSGNEMRNRRGVGPSKVSRLSWSGLRHSASGLGKVALDKAWAGWIINSCKD